MPERSLRHCGCGAASCRRPRPRLKRRVLRSCVAAETALQPWPPALRSTPRAPGRHRAVTSFRHGCLLVARRVPLRLPPLTTRLSQCMLSACGGACPVPSAPFAPQRCLPTVDLIFPRGVPVLCFVVRSSTPRSPSAGRHSFAALRSDARPPPTVPLITAAESPTPQRRPLVARYANSAVRSRRPSGGTRSVRSSLHAIHRQSSVLEPAQLARCATPARKLAPKRKSCSGTP